MTLADIVRILEADRTMLYERICAYSYLPDATSSREAIAMLQGCVLQNARILYLMHLVVTGGGSDGKQTEL